MLIQSDSVMWDDLQARVKALEESLLDHKRMRESNYQNWLSCDKERQEVMERAEKAEARVRKLEAEREYQVAHPAAHTNAGYQGNWYRRDYVEGLESRLKELIEKNQHLEDFISEVNFPHHGR